VACALNCWAAGLDFLANRQIIQSFISFEQNPGACQLARRMGATPEHLLEAGTLFIGQGNMVLFRRPGWSFLLEESFGQRLLFSKTIHQNLCVETLVFSKATAN
jgi:hypothetical protein